MKNIFFTLCVLLFLFFQPGQVSAADYFRTAYKVSYDVTENGITHASINVTLTNTSKEYYASSYKVQVGFPTITNVTASDPLGKIEPEITKTEEGNTIGVTFNKKVVGEGNSLSYVIRFDTPDVAHRIGQIWEIDIPGLSDQAAFDDFSVSVHTPASFGKASYIKPYQPTNTMTFSKEQLGKSGISIAYGEKQVYGFSLTYHLQNQNLFPITTEIALPQSTNYQDVYIDSIEPKPLQVKEDADGNWLATYRLLPSQKVNVLAQGDVVIQHIPKQVKLSQKDLARYTLPKPYWETQDKNIRELALKLRTPRAIYDYLVKNLSYDFSNANVERERLGAKTTLTKKDLAVCLEFTDLFIALARAAGIPAREVDGYAYTENSKQRPLSLVSDILHAWPEYYDSERQTWVMVDPTWGNTTGGVDYFDVLDFDHFAFVIRGIDSQYPIPAGGYKYDTDKKKKDVLITLPEQFITPSASVAVLSDEKPQYSFLPVKVTITIKNTGKTLVLPHAIEITSDTLTPAKQIVKLSQIPPFGSSEMQVSFQKLPLLTNKTFNFTIDIAGIRLKQNITVIPIFLLPSVLIIGGIIFVIFTIIIFIITRKARRVPVS